MVAESMTLHPRICVGRAEDEAYIGKLDSETLDAATELLSIYCGDAGLTLSGLVAALPQELDEECWHNMLPHMGEIWLRLPPNLLRLDENSPSFGNLEPAVQFNLVQGIIRQIEAQQATMPSCDRESDRHRQKIEHLRVLRDIVDILLPLVLKDEILAWADKHMGSPAELVEFVTAEYGVEGRATIQEVLNILRESKDIDCSWGVKEYLRQTLNPSEVQSVLDNGVKPKTDEKSSLDELFHRSSGLRCSDKFVEAVEFMAKFREYSPFNNMLVYQQNPMTTHFATEKDWWKNFERRVKEDARGMLILAPMTPVLMVYDLDDTVGPPLPQKLEEFTQTKGAISDKAMERTLENAKRHCIRVDFKTMGQLYGGFATNNVRPADAKLRIAVREQLSLTSRYSVLCHELAHIFLGHLGGDRDGWWPSRRGLTRRVVEIEAEAVSYIVCRRAGIETKSAEYLASYVLGSTFPNGVSVDLISRVSAKIENMGERLLTAPKRKKEKADR